MPKTIYIAGFLLLAFLAYRFLIANKKTTAGEIAPEIETSLVNGEAFKLSQLKGQYVLLDFWGSWCPPCRKENPTLVALYKKYNQKEFSDASGFEVVTIAIEKNDRTWQSAAEKDGFIWPNQIVEVAKFVALSNFSRKYGVTDLPSKFLIGPDGNLIGKVTFAEVDQVLSERLK